MRQLLLEKHIKVKYCLLSNPAFVVTSSGDFIKVQTNTESDLDPKDGTRKTDCFCPIAPIIQQDLIQLENLVNCQYLVNPNRNA